ncbi:hypothetical protein BI292_07125 [Pseudomonas sp. 43NM1]|uniref:hypothetical protein n=1 Tax=Pseudomonas sp. 43NM1 TaxID=1904755 RepID=UPI000C341E12|nr:hypothetical protein [Pseudomonas sp. 43NM1]PKH38187.1 hypothetical protein BI292_07125 [Pseudomonas sp. 43NM1]
MQTLNNVVAVDWRSGADRCYFFFKDTNTYSRFNLADNEVPEGYPTAIRSSNWNTVHSKLKDLRFGFTTTGINPAHPLDFDSDILWLFYYDGGIPMVCRYDQDDDVATNSYPVSQSIWHTLLPYFDRIVAGTWWEKSPNPRFFRFLMNDGHSLSLNLVTDKLTHEPINDSTWPGLAPYKDRIITAVQNYRTFAYSHYYIFLTNNEYLRYNIPTNRLLAGPIIVDEVSWPGLLRN